ncbi:hypothetical protein HYS50_00740 [Candidatus Woesearchaeota archaeon]|nr:hypothetical protein [Candidatus Woesearchaeota archaeon]
MVPPPDTHWQILLHRYTVVGYIQTAIRQYKGRAATDQEPVKREIAQAVDLYNRDASGHGYVPLTNSITNLDALQEETSRLVKILRQKLDQA